MSALPLVMCDEAGQITELNRPATEILGEVRSRRCCDLVRARDASGNPVCTVSCAGALLGAADGLARDRFATVRDRPWRLICTPMGTSVVVQLLPESRPSAVANTLTPRERQVLELVALGCNSTEIARRLGIRPATVRTHVEHARSKLGARTRAEAVARIGEMLQAK